MTALDEELSRAVVVWTGYGVAPFPDASEARLAQALGPTKAAEILPRVLEAESEAYRSNAAALGATLVEVEAVAREHLRAMREDLASEAIAALAWAYAFSFR